MRIRKLLAFFLCMSLIVCSVPTLVFADETEAADNGTNESKVEEVVETGTEEVIVDGEPAQNGQGGEDGNGDSGDQPIVITPTGDPEISETPDDPSDNYSGKCGENASWTYNNTVLTITGSGDMFAYGFASFPWNEFRSNIKTINISGISNISDYAFFGCSSLTYITIPNSVSTIGNSAFRDCSSLKYITIPNSVTSIDEGAFFGCSSLTSITIPNSVTTIKSNVFSDCTGLKSIKLPDSVTNIGSSAFDGCSSLKSITIPNSVTTIGVSAFFGCSNITSITLSNNLISIDEDAFFGCSSLTTITIPNSVATIGASAFRECHSLTSVTISDSVTTIEKNTFLNCISLESITIPNSVSTIGNSAFENCWSLTSITIPNNVTTIGGSAFKECSSLTSITIPNSVKTIGVSAFDGCSSLTSITIPNSVTTIGFGAFFGCSSLESITIPNSVTTIGDYAFRGCSSLTSITIPDSVTTIGSYAFQYCSSLTSISIPNSVTSIGTSAFARCNRLEKIYCYSNPDNFDNDAFFGIRDKTIIYVDGNYLDAYKKKFGDGYNFVDVSQEIDVLGHRVGLGDQIGIDFFMNIPSGVNVDDLSVSFSWGTGNYAKTASGSFVSTTANGANYIASCAIAARCMTDTVTMTIKKGNTVYATSTFKVVDYVAKVAKNYPAEASSGSDYSNLTYNQKLHTLLLAMLDYGAESQKYFKYRTDDLASNYKGTLVDAGSVRSTVNSAYTNFEAATVSSFASKNTIMNIGDDKIGISYAGAAVACTSKTSFKFYFNKADGYDINSLSATYKGKALTFKEEGDSVTLEIAGLSPKEYAPAGTDLYDCSISLTINGKVYTYTYLDYVYKCNNLNHAFKNTAVALAAYSYFAANLEG